MVRGANYPDGGRRWANKTLLRSWGRAITGSFTDLFTVCTIKRNYDGFSMLYVHYKVATCGDYRSIWAVWFMYHRVRWALAGLGNKKCARWTIVPCGFWWGPSSCNSEFRVSRQSFNLSLEQRLRRRHPLGVINYSLHMFHNKHKVVTVMCTFNSTFNASPTWLHPQARERHLRQHLPIVKTRINGIIFNILERIFLWCDVKSAT